MAIDIGTRSHSHTDNLRFKFHLIVNTDIVEEDVAYRSTPRNGCTANTVADALL